MVALRIIVCVITVVCGAIGAPTVTYDQRQQGEYNLQVDMNDVAIVLLPGSEFAQRNAIIGDKVNQIIGRRRNGADNTSKPKHKKPVTCRTTTTGKTTPVTIAPEVSSYSELPSSHSTTPIYGDVALLTMSTRQGWGDIKPVLETSNTPDIYNRKTTMVHADDYDPYSITPDFFTHKVVSVETEEVTADPAAVTATAVKAIDNFIENITSTLNNLEIPAEDEKANVDSAESISQNSKENPIRVSSDVITIGKTTNDETVQTENKSTSEKTTVKIIEPPKEADSEKITDIESNVKPDEKQTEKTVETPADKEPIESVKKPIQQDKEIVNNADAEVKTNDNEPDKMVAMKTIEKPTFAEALKVVRKPEDVKTEANKAADVESLNNPIEMVAMKTVELPSNGGFIDTIDKSAGITTATKVVEIQGDKHTPRKPAVETIVSRTAPTQTEMVVVKTVENPATITTVKSVTSVKTVIKTGNTKTTSSLSSNGSTIMRKVGDRRPLPSITMEVASPKIT